MTEKRQNTNGALAMGNLVLMMMFALVQEEHIKLHKARLRIEDNAKAVKKCSCPIHWAVVR